MNITLCRYVNDVAQVSINKEPFWLTLTLIRLEAGSRSHDISMFCIEKCKQQEMLVSSKATTPRMVYCLLMFPLFVGFCVRIVFCYAVLYVIFVLQSSQRDSWKLNLCYLALCLFLFLFLIGSWVVCSVCLWHFLVTLTYCLFLWL